MGQYYIAVDEGKKKWFESPDSYCIKYPGICRPDNPFSCMVIMENAEGCNYDIRGDISYDTPNDYVNVTEEIFKKYKKKFFMFFDERNLKKLLEIKQFILDIENFNMVPSHVLDYEHIYNMLDELIQGEEQRIGA